MVNPKLRPWMLTGAGAILTGALQVSPWTAVLMLFMGPLVTAALIQLTMVLLALDCFRGRTARELILVPVFFYAVGPVLFGFGLIERSRLSRELIAESASHAQVLFLDQQHALVLVHEQGAGGSPERHRRGFDTTEVRELMGRYQVSEVYTPATWVDARFHRWSLSEGFCPRGQRGTHVIEIANRYVANACSHRSEQRPVRPLVMVRAERIRREGFLAASVITRIEASAPTGAVSVASSARTSVVFPVTIPWVGCGFEGKFTGWECFATLTRFDLHVAPPGRAGGEVVAPLAEALGVEPRASSAAEEPREWWAGHRRWVAIEFRSAPTS
jgi:hypothetical protein